MLTWKGRHPPIPCRAAAKPAPGFSPRSLTPPYLSYKKIQNPLSPGPGNPMAEPEVSQLCRRASFQGNAWRVAVAASWDFISPFAGTCRPMSVAWLCSGTAPPCPAHPGAEPLLPSTSPTPHRHAGHMHPSGTGALSLNSIHAPKRRQSKGLEKVEQEKQKGGRPKATAEHSTAPQAAKPRLAASLRLPA